MILKALLFLRVLRPYFDIYINGDLYMRRWWLRGDDIKRETGTITAGVHHIVSPDRDSDMHTHPCTFISVILWGWYLERLPRDQRQDPRLDDIHTYTRVRLPLSIAVVRATDRHSIATVSPGGVWTLVIWLRKQGSWGFWTAEGFVPWRQYTQRGTKQ